MMSKKGISWTITNIMAGIIVLIILYVFLAYLFPQMNLLHSSSTGMFDWAILAQDEKNNVNDNFDDFVSLLKKCESKMNCFCGNVNGFPYAFRNEEGLVLAPLGSGMNVTHMWRNQQIGSAEISSFILPNTFNKKTSAITFKDGKYLVDGKKGLDDKPAFFKLDHFFVFNKADTGNALYVSRQKATATC